MNRHRMNHRKRAHLEELFEMAAPGCAPWPLAEPGCPSGKRRWPTEHAAAVALRSARQMRFRRARGNHRGKLETRVYSCAECTGFHLTSMSLEEHESHRR